jgi:hypothetical protein
MGDKVEKYLNYILNELIDNTQYGFFEEYGKTYVSVITPKLKQLGEYQGYTYSKKEVEEWAHTIGIGGIFDTTYVRDVYGLTWLEVKDIIEKYVHILATKVLGEW